MADGEEKSRDFYAVLGLNKECTTPELKDAYKKLALRWHPDRCSSSGNSKSVEESKKKFQAIQQAYSVLSDANKRFLYDVGAYESDDDDSGMGEFLNEMAVMMRETNSDENGDESLEDLQELFDEMFQGDIEALASASSIPSSYMAYHASSSSTNKRSSMETSQGKAEHSSSFDGSHFQTFCLGMEQGRGPGKRRRGGGTTPGAAMNGGRKEWSWKVCSGSKEVTGGYHIFSAFGGVQ